MGTRGAPGDRHFVGLPRKSGPGELARSTIAEQAEFVVTLVDEVLVCRCVSNQAEHVRKVFIKMWQALRPPLLKCPAVLPRIWAT